MLTSLQKSPRAVKKGGEVRTAGWKGNGERRIRNRKDGTGNHRRKENKIKKS